MNQTQILTKNGIRNCFNLRIGDTPFAHDIDYIFQIISLKLIRSDNERSMFQCSLSDGEYKYGCFIFVRDLTNDEFGPNDIIKITSVVHSLMSDKQSDTFIIKKYHVLDRNVRLIGNPSAYSNLPPNVNEENTNNNLIKPNSPSENIKTETQINNSKEKDKKEVRYLHLENLSTYNSNFKVLVRVTQKSDIKPFKSGNGKIFCFNIIDKNGYEMPVAAFNDMADRYYPVIAEGRVYEIFSPKVKTNDKKYSTIKSDFRLNIEDYTAIKEVFDDGSVKYYKFNFKKIKDISEMANETFVDVIGFIYDVGNKTKLKTKLGDMELKRVILADDSETMIEVSLWKEFAARNDLKNDMVVALKNLRIKEFNGKKLNTSEETCIYIEPNVEETNKIKEFKANYEGDYKTINELGSSQNINSNNSVQRLGNYQQGNEPIVPLREVLNNVEQESGSEDKVPYFKVKCYISKFNHDERNVYAGCIECKRKVVPETYGYSCLSCNKKMEEPLYIYSFSIKIKDFSADTYLDVFSQCGEKIIDMSAKEYKELIKEKDKEQDKLNKISHEIELKQFYILVKVKINNFNNQTKKKFSAVKIENVEKDAEINRLSLEISSQLQN